MSKQVKPATKPNASQRLETLETNIQELLMYMNGMNRDIQLLKEAIKLLGNKVDAIQKATGISDDTVADLMIENNISELKEKIAGFVSQGAMVAGPDVVSESSFVVGKEVDDDGKVMNKRVQFALIGLQPPLREKLLGAKVGDKVSFSENTLKFEVEEIYTIVVPKQEEAEVPAEATAEEAPAQA